VPSKGLENAEIKNKDFSACSVVSVIRPVWAVDVLHKIMEVEGV